MEDVQVPSIRQSKGVGEQGLGSIKLTKDTPRFHLPRPEHFPSMLNNKILNDNIKNGIALDECLKSDLYSLTQVPRKDVIFREYISRSLQSDLLIAFRYVPHQTLFII